MTNAPFRESALDGPLCVCAKCEHEQADPNWCHKCGHRVIWPEWAKEFAAYERRRGAEEERERIVIAIAATPPIEEGWGHVCDFIETLPLEGKS